MQARPPQGLSDTRGVIRTVGPDKGPGAGVGARKKAGVGRGLGGRMVQTWSAAWTSAHREGRAGFPWRSGKALRASSAMRSVSGRRRASQPARGGGALSGQRSHHSTSRPRIAGVAVQSGTRRAGRAHGRKSDWRWRSRHVSKKEHNGPNWRALPQRPHSGCPHRGCFPGTLLAAPRRRHKVTCRLSVPA